MWEKGTLSIPVGNGQEILRYAVKHYDNPSEYGINGGRVSKLEIWKDDECRSRVHYERGWDIHPAPDDEAANAALSMLLERFN